MNLLTTFAGSMMEGFLPRGWDLARIDACCAHPPGAIQERQPWWHPRFELVPGWQESEIIPSNKQS